MVNDMPNKILKISVDNNYLDIRDNEHHYIALKDVDITIGLVSKGHFATYLKSCTLSLIMKDASQRYSVIIKIPPRQRVLCL